MKVNREHHDAQQIEVRTQMSEYIDIVQHDYLHDNNDDAIEYISKHSIHNDYTSKCRIRDYIDFQQHKQMTLVYNHR